MRYLVCNMLNFIKKNPDQSVKYYIKFANNKKGRNCQEQS